MQIRTFEELEIWKTARRLTQEVYALSKAPQFSKDYGLRDQMRRASVSIMSNVAEGFERGGNQEFTQYLYVAKASCGEVRSQLYVALDQEYVDQKTRDELLAVTQHLSVMISISSIISNEAACAARSTAIRPNRVLPGPIERLEPLERLEHLERVSQ